MRGPLGGSEASQVVAGVPGQRGMSARTTLRMLAAVTPLAGFACGLGLCDYENRSTTANASLLGANGDTIGAEVGTGEIVLFQTRGSERRSSVSWEVVVPDYGGRVQGLLVAADSSLSDVLLRIPVEGSGPGLVAVGASDDVLVGEAYDRLFEAVAAGRATLGLILDEGQDVGAPVVLKGPLRVERWSDWSRASCS